MKRLLFINACVRAESRTRRLAEELLSGWQGEICELNLEQMDLRPLTAETLARRDALLAAGDYADPAFEPARAIVEADAVVLAAPYWDCSFPASVKVFVEQVMVNGLTFTFTADGVPHGKCRAKKLWYVSTAGGPVMGTNLGFAYIRQVSSLYWGIPEAELIQAEGLDLVGADPEAILSAAAADLPRLL
ncbi:MAG: NAD(P)H-dependent oxidoreductase [Oscillospiraceae bacterium]|nr:NAD(P)H-dependent oxidoreductase [Oscillospiraceae bacterium]